MQALKQGQLPSDFVLPGEDASKIPTTDANTDVPPSTQQPEETTAMEEVMFSFPGPEMRLLTSGSEFLMLLVL